MRQAVRGQWAALAWELLYLTNDDDERYSIQVICLAFYILPTIPSFSADTTLQISLENINSIVITCRHIRVFCEI